MNKECAKPPKSEQVPATDKHPYEPPVLKEHGDAKEVTLQTFFGTFSPN